VWLGDTEELAVPDELTELLAVREAVTLPLALTLCTGREARFKCEEVTRNRLEAPTRAQAMRGAAPGMYACMCTGTQRSDPIKTAATSAPVK
jgi:hypothetical protein